MVSTNFVVDRCENTSFQGGGGGGEKGKGSYGSFTSPHQTICTASYFCLIAAKFCQSCVCFFVSH